MATAVACINVMICGIAASALTPATGLPSSSSTSSGDFDSSFKLGKEAYLENEWELCVKRMENAVAEFNAHRVNTKGCRRKCRDLHAESKFRPLVEDDVEDLHFYERKIRTTHCLMERCEGGRQGEQSVVDDLERRVPYDYLQLCYHRLNKTREAADAAHTYQVRNEGDEQALDNVRWYVDELRAEEPDFQPTDRESLPHEVKFNEAVTLYVQGEWDRVVELMEEAIADYLAAEEDCRLDCEKPFDMGWFPPFVVSVSHHFTFCLKCKRKCQIRLSQFRSQAEEEPVLHSMYFYLMYAYYKVGSTKQVAECIASHQLLDPDHETMATNKEYFLNEASVDNEWFSPRQEAVTYHKRDSYERELEKFIAANFVFADKVNNNS